MDNKNLCMSLYLALRYIPEANIDFYKDLKHKNVRLYSEEEKILVKTADDVDRELKNRLKILEGKKMGLLLSGGMDSAIIASYMRGCDAYTFRFLDGEYQKEELQRARHYADYYGLKLHYVDIDWNVVDRNLDKVMEVKGAPVHSIEPQIVQAALQAKRDGIEEIVIGNASDYVFGGMDGLLSKDWTFDEFYKRYIYISPEDVLNEPVDVKYLFEKYRDGENIDYIAFMEEYAIEESYSSYYNAFKTAGIEYLDPYAGLKMEEKLDLYRIRNGEPKYLIRELFSMKYPDFPVPNKLPMPRPVDSYFANWNGPQRYEFKKNIDMSRLSGNQKWLLYCLERFLNKHQPV